MPVRHHHCSVQSVHKVTIMKRNFLLILTALLSFILYISSVLANNDAYIADTKNKDGEKKYSPLWFGPRIGRRKRNPTEDLFKNLDRDEVETLIEAMRNNPWALVALSNDKRNTVSFTPRLGRDSGEDLEDADFGDFVSQRSPPFAPRLGRRLSPFSPRLGRDNDVLSQ